MKYIARLWENMLARRTLSMVLCLTLAVTSASVCAASTNQLVQETRAAGEKENEPESREAERTKEEESMAHNPVSDSASQMEGEPLTDDREEEEEEEDTRCLHEFTSLWVGYECKLTDYVDGYEPGDEVRIEASFNQSVTSQIGLYIDGAWNSFRGEGKKRNITLVPDSDYLNIQISDLKGLSSVNLTDISVEIVRKGEADLGNYLHKFTGLWQGFETKFSDFNPDYEPGDEIRVTVNFSKYVSSQLGLNLNGQWSTLTGDGKEISKVVTPDNDYLNIQITDMWANYKVGVISIGVEIVKKGPGVQNNEDWNYWGSSRMEPTQYTEPGDYLLFSGDANEKYETHDGWILDCADTDWLTLTYSCVAEHENWGILGWGATIDGEWKDGPGYSADSVDSTKEVTCTFSVNYLRRMMKITPESNVSYLNLGAYSDGRIEELTLHVGSKIPRDMHLFQNGEVNQAWNCTDIERILNAPDDQYICVQYTCATSTFENWTVLTWGASVNGEWRNGKSYKTSYHEATRNHFFSMRMDVFRRMLGLSWDVKVDSIQLSAYNDARILDIWFSDNPVDDPGDSKKEKVVREAKYNSPNKGTYDSVAKDEGEEYPQDTTLDAWEWKDIKNWKEIAKSLKKGVYIVIEYEAEEGIEPNLQFTMSDGKQQGVTPIYLADGQAVFSYEDIQNFLPDYLIPQEISNMQVSSGDGTMTVKKIKVVKNEKELAEEEIAVLTNSWSGFSTQISKWHSGYQVGDTVKVTVTFDKKIPGAIAFHTKGAWNISGYVSSNTITRTAKPDDDYLGIQIGEIPKNMRYAKIMDIKVEIEGKVNYNDYVQLTGDRSMGILADTKENAATAVLTDEEINQGVKVIFETARGMLTAGEKAQVAALFGEQAENIKVAKVPDITVYKEEGEKRTKIEETYEPVSFKVPIPDELLGNGSEFAVVREHKGELTFLEDMDGNESTVTFASSKFSRFAIVYGDSGVFDETSGAITVFRSEWNGFTTSFSKYNSKYKPGKPTKVTLTFDEAVKAYVDYNAPEWTRVEGFGTGKTFTATITPGDDSLTIGIGDLNGNSKVKLLSVKVEQEAEKITEFTAVNQKFATSFSAYNEKFVKGYPVTITLTFDKDVVGSVGYHKDKTLEEMVDSGTSFGKVLTKTFIPGDDELTVWIADMNGNTSVNLTDIQVEQTVNPIYTFQHSWGGEGDTFNGKITDYCSDYEIGDKIKITAVFEKDSQVKIIAGSGGEGKEITATGTRVNLVTVPGSDGFGIQAGDDSKLPLGLLDVMVEIVKKAEPVEAIHKFMEAWAGFETDFRTYNNNFKTGQETIVTLTFDQSAHVQTAFKTANSNWDVRSGSGKEVVLKVTPKEDYMNIQITDMGGETAIHLLSIQVEQNSSEPEGLHEFTSAWSGVEYTLSEYNPDFKAGEETTVTLTFDKEANAQMAFKTEASSWDTHGGTGKEVIATVTPKEDYINIQITDMAGETSIKLLSVKVEQNVSEPEGLHEFTSAWSGVEYTLSEYNPDFKAGEETTVTLTFDKEANAQMAFKTEASSWDTHGGTGKEVIATVTPKEDYINIQITDMAGETSIKLLSVKVEQNVSEPEGLHEFTSAWSGVEYTLSEYNPDFKAGEETTVTLTFDKEANAQMAFKTEASSWDTHGGTGKEVTATVTPKEDYINIQITDMAGESSFKLVSVEVIQESTASAMIMEDFILQEDPVYTFTSLETIHLNLADYWDEYEIGQNVKVELNLFSDGKFCAMTEDADYVTATASNAKALKATASNATPSNAKEANDGIVFESDEDGVLTLKWEGKPKSGEIAVTILDMEGEQIQIDSIDVTEIKEAESVRKAVVSAANNMAATNFPDKASEKEEEEIFVEQEPAKKEEDAAEFADEYKESDPKDRESKKDIQGEAAQKPEESKVELEFLEEELAVPEESKDTDNETSELEEKEV